MNIVCRSMSYCTRKLEQYDMLLGSMFTNIHAITLYTCSIVYLEGKLYLQEQYKTGCMIHCLG